MARLKTYINGNWKYLDLNKKGYKDISKSYNGGGGSFSIDYVYGIYCIEYIQICDNNNLIFRTLLYNDKYFNL